MAQDLCTLVCAQPGSRAEVTTLSQNHWGLDLQHLDPVPLVVLANLQHRFESLNLSLVHGRNALVCRGAGSDDGHNLAVWARRKMNVVKPNDNQ